jgi:hypothetical protein
MQTLMDFLWKSVDAQREGLTIIVNKEEKVVTAKTHEKIYTFTIKESDSDERDENLKN